MFDHLHGLRAWAIVADPRAWLLIVVAASAMLFRAGAFRSRWFDLLKPWKTRPRDRAVGPGGPDRDRPHPLRDPWFVFLLLLASVAVATWIVMSMMVKTQGLR